MPAQLYGQPLGMLLSLRTIENLEAQDDRTDEIAPCPVLHIATDWLPSVLVEENDILEIRARPFSHVLNPHPDQAKEATMRRS